MNASISTSGIWSSKSATALSGSVEIATLSNSVSRCFWISSASTRLSVAIRMDGAVISGVTMPVCLCYGIAANSLRMRVCQHCIQPGRSAAGIGMPMK